MQNVIETMDNKKYNKWCKNYIAGVDLTKIEWQKLTYDELIRFYYNNYYDDVYQSFAVNCINDRFLPFGMVYLPINPNNSQEEYLLGLCRNRLGKKTIVACIAFLPHYIADYRQIKPYTYITTVETNTFFHQQGVFKQALLELPKVIDLNQDIVISPENGMGKLVHVIDHIKKVFQQIQYCGDIRSECDIDEKYFIKTITPIKKKVL